MKLVMPLALSVSSTLCAGPYVQVPVAQGVQASCSDGTARSQPQHHFLSDQPPKQTFCTLCSVPGVGGMRDVQTWEQLSPCTSCNGFSFGEMCT